MFESISWVDNTIRAVDQRRLPHQLVWLTLPEVDDVIDAITTLAVRGAPLLGIAGALGTALSAHRHTVDGVVDRAAVGRDADRLAAARPTAVNLSVGVRRAMSRLDGGADAVLDEALALLGEDSQINRRVARRAAELLQADRVTAGGPNRPLRILTHCNTGSLATVGGGTALGAIAELAARGLVESVLVGETRPLLQGARLTTWELDRLGIPYRLLVDSAAPAAMAAGLVDCVVVGADRIAANGDVANKIGTYALAVAAHHHRIPFVVVATEASVDTSRADGAEITIEHRDADEVVRFGTAQVAAPGTPAWNPAFDVTPAELIRAVVTEDRVLNRPVPDALVAAAVRGMPVYPKPGTTFFDLAPVYARPDLFDAAVGHLAHGLRGKVDAIVAADARGLVLGTALALRLNVKLVLADKPDPLPGSADTATSRQDLAPDELQVAADTLAPGERVCLADEVLATGDTVAAMTSLVHRLGARVTAVAALMTLPHFGTQHAVEMPPVHAVVDIGASVELAETGR